MATFYRVIKTIYHGLVPVGMRGPLHDKRTLKGRVFLAILKRLEARGRHDEIYDSDYFERLIDPAADTSAPIIAASIVETFRPHSVIDIGCGSGAILHAFKLQNVKTFGVDGARAALDFCHSRGLDVERFDLESNQPFPRTADVVISTEVAEHLPASRADAYVALLVAIAPIIVMTAATPGQGGTDHVNEQPHSYWIAKFTALGCEHLSEVTKRWRSHWAGVGVASCYCQNVLVFRRRSDPASA